MDPQGLSEAAGRVEELEQNRARTRDQAHHAAEKAEEALRSLITNTEFNLEFLADSSSKRPLQQVCMRREG